MQWLAPFVQVESLPPLAHRIVAHVHLGSSRTTLPDLVLRASKGNTRRGLDGTIASTAQPASSKTSMVIMNATIARTPNFGRLLAQLRAPPVLRQNGLAD
jgi:hypothetical protein